MMCNRTGQPHESVGEHSTSDVSSRNHQVDGETAGLLAGRAILTTTVGVLDVTTDGNKDETKQLSSFSSSSTKRAIGHEESTGSLKKKKKVSSKDDESLDTKLIKSGKCTTASADETTVTRYTDKDVLSGRGGGTNLHAGNRFYRQLILSNRTAYDDASKAMKPEIARQIVEQIRNSGGRFLRKDKDGEYRDIGETEAKEKTSQALRHRTFELRNMEDPNRVKMGGRWKPDSEKRSVDSVRKSCLVLDARTWLCFSQHPPHLTKYAPFPIQIDLEDKKESSSAVNRLLPASMPTRSGLNASNHVGSASNDSSSASLMLNGQRLETGHGAVDVTSNLPEGFLHRRDGTHGLSLTGIPDDLSYQRALATLRHRKAMLNLDKAIHDAEMTRRISSMASSLSSSFPGSLSHELSARRDGATFPPTLFSMPGNSVLMNFAGASRQSTLGGFTSSARSLRNNMMNLELPTVASSLAMENWLSVHGSLRRMHQGSPVGTYGGSSPRAGVAFDRASLQQLNERANSHRRQSPQR